MSQPVDAIPGALVKEDLVVGNGALAYGEHGGVIPPQATLVFEVALLEIT